MLVRLHLGLRYFEFDKPLDAEGYNQSSVRFCPICNEVWARLMVEGAAHCICVRAACEDCASPSEFDAVWSELFPIPGSLVSNLCYYKGIDRALLAGLPYELMVRELELTLRFIKEQPIERTTTDTSNDLTEASLERACVEANRLIDAGHTISIIPTAWHQRVT